MGRVTDIISKKVNLSPKTYQRAAKIIEFGSDAVKQKLRNGISTISKEYQKILREQKRQELMVAASKNRLPNKCQLYLGDFEKVGKEHIKNNSVHMIFTDPPYNLEGLGTYEKLGRFASRVLVDGGFLVTYAGQYYLNRIFKILDASSLNYFWAFCVKHSEDHQLVYSRNVFYEWKPILVYLKGKCNMIGKISDHIESEQPEKVNGWQQSTVECDYLVAHLSSKNQILCDPCLGSGTTGISALKLNRQFIGIEKNQETFELAKKRLSI